MQRNKKLINTDTKTKLYNAYLLPHLYIITVSCGTIAVNAVKLMNAAYDLFSMIMTVIVCNYLIVWAMGQPSLFNERVHYILSLVYKSLDGLAPEYITNMFSLR